MKKILLSSDDKMKMYLVPEDVADNLKEYCMYFSFEWILKDPCATKYVTITINMLCLMAWGVLEEQGYLQ